MPIVTAQGAFNVGRDCQIVIQHPLAPGGRIDIPNVTGFSCKQVTAAVKTDRLDGVQLAAELPKGWTLSFMADRGDSGVDDLFVLIEQAWYSPLGQVYPATVFQYIQEVNGGQSTYQFTSVSLKFDDAGDWRGDAIVKQTISGTAFTRVRV